MQLAVYDYETAIIADRVGIDILCVSDTGGMVLFGHETTTSVSFEEVMFMAQAVKRGSKYGLRMVDMPYMSFHLSAQQAVDNAAKYVSQGGAEVMKCEGNQHHAKYIEAIVKAGIPVQGHIGITPMRMPQLGGFFAQGKTADRAKELMRANPNLLGVNDDWNESIKVLRLQVDQDKARALGVTSQSIAQAARILVTGSTVSQYREADRLIDIVLRQPVQERDTLSELANAYVPTASGRSVPLTQVAKPQFTWEPGRMHRESRQFTITVQGDVIEGLQGATVTNQVWPALDAMRKDMPPGYSITIAGAVEESSKGTGSIAAGVPIMLFITFTLLMLQLHSFSRAMLAFLTGFLGIAGVSAALLLLNRPFGFVALLGVIALMGMIQRNSVILIDQIEQDRGRGVPPAQAIVESAVRRLRPIALTAAAAVLAMVPLSRSVFWGPMAVAIMGGLIVATVLTLLALPAMYAAWFRVERDKDAGIAPSTH